MKKLELKGTSLVLDEPLVMGILNLTDDSFFDGGRFVDIEKALDQVQEMVEAGAAIIDIGAASSRPGAPISKPEEELERLLPLLTQLKIDFPEVVVSIDTYHGLVADACLTGGADIINDVSAGSIDAGLFAVVAAHKAPYVLMHMAGTPANMQLNPEYNDVVSEVHAFFDEKIKLLEAAGVEQIILDPGIGFGKTVEHNLALIKNLSSFSDFNKPMLMGVSRKSVINKILKTSPEKALNGTTVLNTLALSNGANILRVHDVREAREAVQLTQAYLSNGEA